MTSPSLRQVNTLRAYKEKPLTRQRLLKLLAQRDVHILTIRLNKERVHTNLREEKHVLYNYVVNILLDRMMRNKLVPNKDRVCFVASKRETNRFLNENFSDYLRTQTRQNHKLDIEVTIATPSEDKGLQVADCLAWSFFRKYEHGDNSYVSLIQSKIIEENGLFE